MSMYSSNKLRGFPSKVRKFLNTHLLPTRVAPNERGESYLSFGVSLTENGCVSKKLCIINDIPVKVSDDISISQYITAYVEDQLRVSQDVDVLVKTIERVSVKSP